MGVLGLVMMVFCVAAFLFFALGLHARSGLDERERRVKRAEESVNPRIAELDKREAELRKRERLVDGAMQDALRREEAIKEREEALTNLEAEDDEEESDERTSESSREEMARSRLRRDADALHLEVSSEALVCSEVEHLNEHAVPSYYCETDEDDEADPDEAIACGICGCTNMRQVYQGESRGVFEGYLGIYCFECGEGKCMNRGVCASNSESVRDNLFTLFAKWRLERVAAASPAADETLPTGMASSVTRREA